jgi:hypothetical protein
MSRAAAPNATGIVPIGDWQQFGRARRFLITQVANLEKTCYYSVRGLRMLGGSRVDRSSHPTSDFAHETALNGAPTPRRKI